MIELKLLLTCRMSIESSIQVMAYVQPAAVTRTKTGQNILTRDAQDFLCEKLIEDASVSHQIQCILVFTSQINLWF